MTIYFKAFLILTLSFFNSILSAAELTEINAEQLKTMQSEQQALIVDIRSSAEVTKRGVIPGSKVITFYDDDGNSDAQVWLAKLNAQKQSPDQAVILVCHGGVRSAQVGNFLTKEINMDNIYSLSDGYYSWAKQGNPTVIPETPAP